MGSGCARGAIPFPTPPPESRFYGLLCIIGPQDPEQPPPKPPNPNPPHHGPPRTVDNSIPPLRSTLEDAPAEPKHIVTVRGVGYRFVP